MWAVGGLCAEDGERGVIEFNREGAKGYPQISQIFAD